MATLSDSNLEHFKELRVSERPSAIPCPEVQSIESSESPSNVLKEPSNPEALTSFTVETSAPSTLEISSLSTLVPLAEGTTNLCSEQSPTTTRKEEGIRHAKTVFKDLYLKSRSTLRELNGDPDPLRQLVMNTRGFLQKFNDALSDFTIPERPSQARSEYVPMPLWPLVVRMILRTAEALCTQERLFKLQPAYSEAIYSALESTFQARTFTLQQYANPTSTLDQFDQTICKLMHSWGVCLVSQFVCASEDTKRTSLLRSGYLAWEGTERIRYTVLKSHPIMINLIGELVAAAAEQISSFGTQSLADLYKNNLPSNVQELAKQTSHFLERLCRRSTKQWHCTRYYWQLTSVCAQIFFASAEECEEGLKALVHLDLHHAVIPERNLIIYFSPSLLDSTKRKVFLQAALDRSDMFENDYVIIRVCSSSDHVPSTDLEIAKEFLQLVPPDFNKENTLYVCSRNSSKRTLLLDRWARQFGSKITIKKSSGIEAIDALLARLCGTFVGLCYTLLKILLRCRDLQLETHDPTFMLNAYQSILTFTFDALRFERDSFKGFEVEWEILVDNLCNWIMLIVRANLNELDKTKCIRRLFSALKLVNGFIWNCPYQETLTSSALSPTLQTAAKQLQEFKGQFCTAGQFSSAGNDLVFCQYYIYKCLQKLDQNKSLSWKTTHLTILGTLQAGCKVLQVLSSSSNSSVYKCFDFRSNQIVAIKELPIRHTGELFTALQEELLQEANFLKVIRHPNVVDFVDIAVVGSKVFLRMEFFSGTSLLEYAQERGPITDEEFLCKCTFQILLGLAFLHARSIVHRDVKPGNILIDEAGQIKLVDFGAAKSIAMLVQHEPGTREIGTIEYMAPEVARGEGQSTKSDVWSLGCTLLHIVTGKLPWWPQDNPWSIMYKLGRGETPPLDGLEASGLCKKTIDLIRTCLNADQSQRPTAQLLLHDEYIYQSMELE